MSKVVHIVGTGTIGEPLIGLFTDFAAKMGIDEVTFHKRTPLRTDRAKLEHLMARGARLAVDDDRRAEFRELGHEVTYETNEALERASVVIDCTPAGNRHKTHYESLSGVKGFLAQGSEFDFGKPYARGINEDVLVPGDDRFIQIVSCNTHNITTLIRTIAGKEDGSYRLDSANFVCIRRANDITQVNKFVPSPHVGLHDDDEFGTHHARDAHRLFATQGHDFDLFSSAVKVNSQYMHSIWFKIRLTEDVTKEEILSRIESSPRVAVTEKRDANLIFSFGRDHGYYGRILSQTVVVLPTVHVKRDRDVYGFCFTPQDGNSLVSSIAAALWSIDPDWDEVAERLSPIRRWVYSEI